jgi:hypothetical protein
VLGRNAEFFAIRRSEPVDIVVFTIGLVLLPPLALFAVEALADLADARAGRAVHLVLVAGLSGLLALLVLKKTGASSGVLAPLCALAGVAAAVVYTRAEVARTFLSVLAPAPLVVMVLFLFTTPVHRLLSPDEANAALAPEGGRAPVVMFIFDELPLTSLLREDGRIDARRFPNFARLARLSHWFRNASSVDAQTQVAVPAIMTGRRPDPDALPTAEDQPHSIFSLLGRGRRMHVHEAITQLCPAELCGDDRPGFSSRIRSLVSDLSVVSLHVLLPQDLRHRLPSIDSSWQNFLGGDDAPASNARPGASALFIELFEEKGADRGRVGVATRFIAGIPRSSRGRPGALNVMHILLPHVPWMYMPDGRRYGNVAPELGLTNERWGPDQGAATVGWQRSLLQIQLIDRLIGALLRKLRSNGTFDESLIVVTADHGAAYRAGEPRRAVNRANIVDIAPVPLFVKTPHERRGQVHSNHVATIDILPTVASVLGVRVPWRLEGRSVFAPGNDRRVVHQANAGRHPVEISTRRLDAERVAALRRQVALLGQGGFPAPRRVPGVDLVGRPVPASAAPMAAASAQVDGAVAFAAVDRRSAFIPLHVTGTVLGFERGGIAVAVNGRVRAVTPLVRDGDRRRFSAILPESALRDGANRVEILGVTGGPRREHVASLASIDPGSVQYALRDGVIVAAHGRRLPIRAGAVRGGVDNSASKDGELTLSGWAIGPGHGGAVDQVIGFDGHRVVFYGRPERPRLDIAQKYGLRPWNLGFLFAVPEAGLHGAPSVYAVRGGVASRLDWFCGGNQAVGC